MLEKEVQLLKAVELGENEEVEKLIQEGTNVNIGDVYKRTPLHVSCEYGHEKTTKLLIDAGANLNTGDCLFGDTPLIQASSRGNMKIVKLLINAGADLNARDNSGRTALFLAAVNRHTEIEKLLLDAGANPNIPNKHTAETPLFWVSRFNLNESIKRLLEAGANSDFNTSAQTPLLRAVFNRNMETVKLFLDFGVNHTNIRKAIIANSRKTNNPTIHLLQSYPTIVPLRTLCLRIILVKTNNVVVPPWLPPILLEWPTIEEICCSK